MPADGTIAAHYSQPTSAPSGGLQTTSALKIEIEAYNAIFFKGVTLTFFPFSFFLFQKAARDLQRGSLNGIRAGRSVKSFTDKSFY